MVDLSSARLDNGRETVLELDGDHSGICKFSGPDDHAYSSVGPGIESMVDKQKNIEQDASTTNQMPVR